MLLNILFSFPVHGEVIRDNCFLEKEIFHVPSNEEIISPDFITSAVENSITLDTFYVTVYICPGEVIDSVLVNGINYWIEGGISEEGVYEYLLSDAPPFILFLTVVFENHTIITYHLGTLCEGESVSYYGQTYNTSGQYYLNPYYGIHCDSVEVLTLTVHDTFYTETYATICQGEEYYFQGQSFTEEGSHPVIYPHPLTGCDSTYMLYLTVNPTYADTITTSICEGELYDFHNDIISTTGTYYKAFLTSQGCDSLFTLHLTVHPTAETYLNEAICDGEEFYVGFSIYTTTGIYSDTLWTNHGCDSVVNLNLTVFPLFETVLNGEICDGDTYSVGSSVYTASGTYTDILPDVNGCDSTVILNLTVHSLFEIVLYEEICDGDSYTVGSSIYTSSGTYTDILPDVNGCDSTVILNLTVHSLFETVLNEEICDGDSYTVGTSVYTTSGTYTDILPDVNGCDSTVILHLTVHSIFETVLNEEICDGDS